MFGDNPYVSSSPSPSSVKIKGMNFLPSVPVTGAPTFASENILKIGHRLVTLLIVSRAMSVEWVILKGHVLVRCKV